MVTNGKPEPEKSETTKPTCFVVCPIGSDLSPERKHSNQVYKYLISPVLEAAGFEKPLRSDMISEGGNITRQIINHLLEDDLVIADLTGKNPNVYYELAIRHCVAKPFIQLITTGETIPFDISQQRTIHFDRTDLDSMEQAKAELAKHVTSAMTSPNVDTPIGAALDFEKLKSGGGVERALSVLLDKVDHLLAPRQHRSLPQALATIRDFAEQSQAYGEEFRSSPDELSRFLEALQVVGTDGYHEALNHPQIVDPELLERLRRPSVQKSIEKAVQAMRQSPETD